MVGCGFGRSQAAIIRPWKVRQLSSGREGKWKIKTLACFHVVVITALTVKNYAHVSLPLEDLIGIMGSPLLTLVIFYVVEGNVQHTLERVDEFTGGDEHGIVQS